jgi:hypothetical protein
MASRNEQSNEWKCRWGVRQQRRQQMALEVVNADGRHAQRIGQRACHAGSDEKRTRQAGTLGECDAFDLREVATGLGEDLADQGEDPANVVARGELRHHAAVFGMHLDLRVQGLGEQTTALWRYRTTALWRNGTRARCRRAGAGIGEAVERDPGFVAGCLDT